MCRYVKLLYKIILLVSLLPVTCIFFIVPMNNIGETYYFVYKGFINRFGMRVEIRIIRILGARPF